jgi:2-(1,2-epoxy-1,2-dihydrophenyl)acetyl-CoA isomerase
MTSTEDMSARLALGQRLYQALGSGDVDVLRELLAEDFQGHLSAGLPHGFGQRTYDGRERMLSEGWGAIGGYFEMSPHVEELLVAGDFLIGAATTSAPPSRPASR